MNISISSSGNSLRICAIRSAAKGCRIPLRTAALGAPKKYPLLSIKRSASSSSIIASSNTSHAPSAAGAVLSDGDICPDQGLRRLSWKSYPCFSEGSSSIALPRKSAHWCESQAVYAVSSLERLVFLILI
jgi:hypothetical protein